jgi:hypothetical protein
MVKVAAAAAAAAQVGVKTRTRATKKRSRHIKISIKVRSNVTSSRQERVIIRSDNSASYPLDVNSGHRMVTEERCSSPSLDDDFEDNHSLMSSTSCCSSNGSCDEIIKFTDLEVRIASILSS